ncbi:hypothetical protein AVEN_8610-1 [Araneus ventricosus]|uniref:Tc3 transposase DNA binding domain-containing protein n=1 Tax=Araneus ventricosus TaxID=182803 RepID=A0A4Y2C5X1_ARAVE|nr:hypothetical protein AVEN_8610-1 [Araneus ventricosus]
MEPIRVRRCGWQRLYKTTSVWHLDRSVTAATRAGYQDLSEFERGVIVGAREMGHSIPEVAMKFGFSRTTISRVYRDYRESGKIAAAGKRSCMNGTNDD